MAIFWGKRNTTRTGMYETPEEIIKPGDGINTYQTAFEIKRSEAVSMLNMSDRYYPSISVRPGMTYEFDSDSIPATSINSLGVRNGTYLHVLDGVLWKYWSTSGVYINVSTSEISASSKFLEFNTETVRYTLLAGSSYLKNYNGTTVSATTSAPQTRLYTIDDYRLYALSGSVIKCSAAGSISDWTTADDADSITVTGMQGVGTAIVAYNDMVIAWSDQTMHILYGNDPLDFQLSDAIPNGCVSDKSIIIFDGILYFMDYNKIMVFTGGLPTEISQKVKSYLENINYTYKDKICTGMIGEYLYFSIPYGTSATTNNLTLEYDTQRKTWYVWNKGFLSFTKIGEYTYGVDTSGYIWKLGQGTDDDGTAITWEISFGVWNSLPARGKKVISDIWTIVDLPVGSTMNVYYSETVDSTTDWTLLYTYTANANEQNTRLQIPTNILQDIDWYRLKFSGTGHSVIHYIEPYARIKRR